MPEKRKLSITDVDAAIVHLEAALKMLNAARGSEPNKKKANPNHNGIKIGFMSFYKENKKIEYIWSAKDGTQLNLLISKIEALINISKAKNTGTVEDIFKVVLNKLKKTDKQKSVDEFTWSNLSISIINNRFNEIIASIKNPKGTNKEIDDYKKSLEKRLNPK